MDAFLIALGEDHVLHDLEVLGDRGFVTFDTVLQPDNGTDGLAALVDHPEGLRDLTDLHGVDHLRHFLRQVLHLEARGDTTRLHVGVRHQTLVVAGVLVIGQQTGSLLKGKLFAADISGDGVQPSDGLLHILLSHHRLLQDMTHIDLVTTLLHQLDDMETELRLHNLRDLLRVGEIEGHGGKGGVQRCTAHETQFTTLTGRSRVFGIEACQGLERRLALGDTFGIVAELVLHTVDLLGTDARGHGHNLHLHLGRHVRQTVGRQVAEITTHIGRGHRDILDQLPLHLLDFLTVAELLTHLLTHLGNRLVLVFLQTLAGAIDHLQPVADLLFDLLRHVVLSDLDTVDIRLMEEEFVDGNLFGDGAVGVPTPLHAFQGSLHAQGLDIGLEDGLITHHPDDLVDDGLRGSRLEGVGGRS